MDSTRGGFGRRAAARGVRRSSETALCRPNIDPHLTPPGVVLNAFTMGIRVNRASDVDEINSAIGDRILPRDVFVINTEYPHSKPERLAAGARPVAEKFRCNRIVTLTGPQPDPQSPAMSTRWSTSPSWTRFWSTGSRTRGRPPAKGLDDRPGCERESHRRPAPGALPHHLADSRVRMGLVPDYVPAGTTAPSAESSPSRTIRPRSRSISATRSSKRSRTAGRHRRPAADPRVTDQCSRRIGRFSASAPGSVPRGTSRPTSPATSATTSASRSPSISRRTRTRASGGADRAGAGRDLQQQILRAGGAGVLYWADPTRSGDADQPRRASPCASHTTPH